MICVSRVGNGEITGSSRPAGGAWGLSPAPNATMMDAGISLRGLLLSPEDNSKCWMTPWPGVGGGKHKSWVARTRLAP